MTEALSQFPLSQSCGASVLAMGLGSSISVFVVHKSAPHQQVHIRADFSKGNCSEAPAKLSHSGLTNDKGFGSVPTCVALMYAGCSRA